jgi:hypothetical protein
LVMQKQVISQQKQEFEKAQLEAKKAKELE